MPNRITATIYIELLDEGTKVFRPVQATSLGGGLFRIETENANPEDERWRFAAGAVVRCAVRDLSSVDKALVAVEGSAATE